MAAPTNTRAICLNLKGSSFLPKLSYNRQCPATLNYLSPSQGVTPSINTTFNYSLSPKPPVSPPEF